MACDVLPVAILPFEVDLDFDRGTVYYNSWMGMRIGIVNGRAASYHFNSPITSRGEKRVKTCKLPNVCVWRAALCHLNYNTLRVQGRIVQIYLSKLQKVFVQFVKYICLNCKMYLSKGPASYHLYSPITSWGRKGEKCANHSKHWKQTYKQPRPKNTGEREQWLLERWRKRKNSKDHSCQKHCQRWNVMCYHFFWLICIAHWEFNADWFSLILIDADWYWLLVDADWC